MKLMKAPRGIGDGTHAELQLEKDGEGIRALAWRMMDRVRNLEEGSQIDVVFHPTINRFRGKTSVEWTIEDLRTID